MKARQTVGIRPAIKPVSGESGSIYTNPGESHGMSVPPEQLPRPASEPHTFSLINYDKIAMAQELRRQTIYPPISWAANQLSRAKPVVGQVSPTTPATATAASGCPRST